MELTLEKGRGYVPAEENKKAAARGRNNLYRFYLYTQ